MGQGIAGGRTPGPLHTTYWTWGSIGGGQEPGRGDADADAGRRRPTQTDADSTREEGRQNGRGVYLVTATSGDDGARGVRSAVPSASTSPDAAAFRGAPCSASMPLPLQCMSVPSHHLTISPCHWPWAPWVGAVAARRSVPASCRGFLAALAVWDASRGRAQIAAPYPAPCSNIGLLGLVSWLMAHGSWLLLST
jgi:hypothetical protein